MLEMVVASWDLIENFISTLALEWKVATHEHVEEYT